MVKDLFAIEGRKAGNGNPNFYQHATPARDTAPVINRLLEAGASMTGITICDEFFYSVLGSNAHYGQPVNSRAPGRVTGGSSWARRRRSRHRCAIRPRQRHRRVDPCAGVVLAGSPAWRLTHGRIALDGVPPMAPSFDTVGFSPVTPRCPHHRPGAARRRAGRRADQAPDHCRGHVRACRDRRGRGDWQVFSKIGRSLPQAERNIVAGARLAGWRDASGSFRASKFVDAAAFIRSHKVELGPGIKERFDIAAAISFAEAEAAREVRAEIADRLHGMAKPGSVIALPTTPTLRQSAASPTAPPLPSFALKRWVLPVSPAMAACPDLDSGQRGSRLPDRAVVHRLAGRRRGIARFGRPA